MGQSGNVMSFRQRIGFDEGELVQQVRVIDNRAKVVLIGRQNLQVWDITTARLLSSQLHEIKKRGDEDFLLSPDGKRLMGVRNRFVPLNLTKDDRPDPALIYDLSTGKLVGTLQRPAMPIRSAEWSANGETIVSFSNTSQKETEISFWSGSNFAWRSSFTVRGYGWH